MWSPAGDPARPHSRHAGRVRAPSRVESVVQVVVQVRGYVDPLLDFWPYLTELRAVPAGHLLTLDVHDSRELVSALLALADRGLEIGEVETQRPGTATGG